MCILYNELNSRWVRAQKATYPTSHSGKCWVYNTLLQIRQIELEERRRQLSRGLAKIEGLVSINIFRAYHELQLKHVKNKTRCKKGIIDWDTMMDNKTSNNYNFNHSWNADHAQTQRREALKALQINLLNSKHATNELRAYIGAEGINIATIQDYYQEKQTRQITGINPKQWSVTKRKQTDQL